MEQRIGRCHRYGQQRDVLVINFLNRQNAADARLYELLENEIIPLFFERDEQNVPGKWIQRMRSTLAQICPYFNTHRMVEEYVEQYYVPAAQRVTA